MRPPTERYPAIRYVGLAVALILSAAVVASLLIIAAGLNDEQSEVDEVSELLETIAAESGAVTDGYLAAAESSAQVVARSLGDGDDVNGDQLVELLGQLTATHSNVVGAFVGYPDGEFVDIRRDEESATGGFRTKTIAIEGGTRTVELTRTDTLLDPFERALDDADEYDPRVRPWYEGVLAGRDVLWTEPYIFFSSQEPGITHSVAVRDDGGNLQAVVGIDVRLADLNAFLSERTPSVNGSAVVINEAGSVIAGSNTLDPDDVNSEVDDDAAALLAAVPSLIDEVSGPSPWVARWSDSAAHVIATQPVSATADWLLVVEAPEEDFLQDVRRERRQYAVVATLVGALSTLLFIAGAVWLTNHIERLRRLSRTDQLTGTLNRATVRRELDRMLLRWEGRGQVAAMILDLDEFKTINDQYGHDAGDQVLVTMATRLVEGAGARSVVGRLGGDEFLVVVPPTGRGDHVTNVFNDMIEKLSRPIDAAGFQLDVHASAGFSIQGEDESKTASQMLSEADVALYDAKDVYGSSLLRFDDSMQLRSARDYRRQTELESAIQRRQFTLYFQPELDLASGEIVGAEALLRWEHPVRGTVPAAEFIVDLERFGLLGQLLPQIIEESADFASRYAARPFTMRINLAAEQLVDRRLVPLLSEAVRRVPTVDFCLEVTERSILEASPTVLATLGQLRELDIHVALDDFGTGYSSLKELQELPVDTIKIDRTFIAELGSGDPHKSVVAILLDLAELMDVAVVAEGVETREQRAALVELGCLRAQGFLLGRPMSIDAFRARFPPVVDAPIAA